MLRPAQGARHADDLAARLPPHRARHDILATAPFATPWTFALLNTQLSETNVAMGGAPLPPFELVHILISCLMGSLVMLWSFMRLAEPSVALGRYDALGRFMFSAWMIWALVQGGLSLVWLFLIPELLWGVAQYWPVTAGAPRPPGKRGLSLVHAS